VPAPGSGPIPTRTWRSSPGCWTESSSTRTRRDTRASSTRGSPSG
jgi:hypothetical protein